MLYKPLTACEKKSSRIRTFPMAASSNFFSLSPGAAQNILHLNFTQHATGERILKQHPILACRHQKTRATVLSYVLRGHPASCLKKSSPSPFGRRPPLRHFPSFP